MVDIDEFLKDKLNLKFVIINRIHTLSYMQLKALILEYHDLQVRIHEKHNTIQPVPLKGTPGASDEDAPGAPS